MKRLGFFQDAFGEVIFITTTRPIGHTHRASELVFYIYRQIRGPTVDMVYNHVLVTVSEP